MNIMDKDLFKKLLIDREQAYSDISGIGAPKIESSGGSGERNQYIKEAPQQQARLGVPATKKRYMLPIVGLTIKDVGMEQFNTAMGREYASRKRKHDIDDYNNGTNECDDMVARLAASEARYRKLEDRLITFENEQAVLFGRMTEEHLSKMKDANLQFDQLQQDNIVLTKGIDKMEARVDAVSRDGHTQIEKLKSENEHLVQEIERLKAKALASSQEANLRFENMNKEKAHLAREIEKLEAGSGQVNEANEQQEGVLKENSQLERKVDEPRVEAFAPSNEGEARVDGAQKENEQLVEGPRGQTTQAVASPKDEPLVPDTLSSTLVSAEDKQKEDNIRQTYIKVKRRLDNLQSIAFDLCRCTRTLNLATFEMMGECLERLRGALDEHESTTRHSGV
ncbi:hypothetical protein BKA66DRAFT_447169 [Pyrenochaeta sp. MPI-SDFR-AT-0127]|nr:hypothetical protein BKA66DRAFT_447169 [Pyrenochaeta sp. MPI-SDFR-AT-0127]